MKYFIATIVSALFLLGVSACVDSTNSTEQDSAVVEDVVSTNSDDTSSESEDVSEEGETVDDVSTESTDVPSDSSE